MSKIEWADVNSGHGKIGENGFVTVGQTLIKIASIGWSTQRNDPKPWVLRTELPGWKSGRHHETVDDAKASAERILQTFVRALTDGSAPEEDA
jgi:hypothetical protein